jgi:hypothetical protein
MVDSKFGSLWGRWCSNEPSGAFGVGLWKNIKRSWGKFLSHTRFEEGDGSKKPFHIYLVLPTQWMPLLQLTLGFIVVPISGM